MSPMFALYAWPVVTAVILGKFRLHIAILTAMILGYLFLPVRFAIDFPLIPELNKHALPILTIVALTVVFKSLRVDVDRQRGVMPKSWIARGLIAFLLLGAFGTALTNGDRIVTPLEVKPGLGLYEGLSMSIVYLLLILPVFIGRKYFARPEAHRLILIALCIAGCGYALFALFEVRMSPQLNRWLYGFTPHSWLQHIRGGGFRPMVFLEHGLRVSLFFALALIATLGLLRVGWKSGLMVFAAFWLAVTLILTKSLGAVVIAAVIAPMIFFLTTRGLLAAAALIGMIVMTYPILRGGGMIPIERAVELASFASDQRVASFLTRIENEDILLDRAMERPAYGWGGFGRSRVRNEKGIDIVIPDGYWVIIIGWGGWSRYIGEFGLMAIPMLLLFWKRRTLNLSRETAILAIILAGNMIDLIPNSGQTPFTWLIAGALWGRLEYNQKIDTEEPTEGDPPKGDNGNQPRYARDFNGGMKVRQPAQTKGRQARTKTTARSSTPNRI